MKTAVTLYNDVSLAAMMLSPYFVPGKAWNDDDGTYAAPRRRCHARRSACVWSVIRHEPRTTGPQGAITGMPKHCHSLARRHLAPEGATRMHCVVYSSYIAGVTFGILLHARRYGRSLLAVALCPFVRHKSEFCQKGWTDSAVFCFFSRRPILHYVLRKCGIF